MKQAEPVDRNSLTDEMEGTRLVQNDYLFSSANPVGGSSVCWK